MENIRDWCISRQIWWGHRLPVWIPAGISNDKFQNECLKANEIQNLNDSKLDHLKLNKNLKLEIENYDKIYVGDEPPKGYKQVDDVLDTWFSSALWPFATLGYPKETDDLKKFYPTTILSTARDINMLWVVRMIFSGFEFMGEKPFSQVYIHPTVFNKDGKRMSKSLGTGIDPLMLIDKYGADATRFGLAYINTGTQDIKFDENAILMGQKFANKVWNISRFVMQQIGNPKSKILNPKQIPNPKSENDKKILSHLTSLISSVNSDLDHFRFGQAAHNIYDFIWHDFADVYIEEFKQANSKQHTADSFAVSREPSAVSQDTLLFVLRNSLLLLHPFMPFLTEGIWQTLHEEKLVSEKMLINAKWPTKTA